MTAPALPTINHWDLDGPAAIHPIMFVQATDPGAVGAGKWWCNTTAGDTLTTGAVLNMRNLTNDGWILRADITAALGVLQTAIGAETTARTSDVATLNAAIALKAALASPALTGIPTAPTATVGTNTAQLATTAFVAAAISALIGAAPAALDTLKELADAINDDASYAATITSLLALKAPLANPTFTGHVAVPTPTNPSDAVTKAYADALGGGGGGSTTLAALTDVLLTSLADGDALHYDSASGKWKNGAPTAPVDFGSHAYWRVRAKHDGYIALTAILFKDRSSSAIPTTGGTALESSHYVSSSDSSALFDGVNSTFWESTNAHQQWAGYHFSAPVSVTQVALQKSASMDGSFPPVHFALEYSNDGITWKSVGEVDVALAAFTNDVPLWFDFLAGVV